MLLHCDGFNQHTPFIHSFKIITALSGKSLIFGSVVSQMVSSGTAYFLCLRPDVAYAPAAALPTAQNLLDTQFPITDKEFAQRKGLLSFLAS